MTVYGTPRYGPHLYGTGGNSDVFGDITYELSRKLDSCPVLKIEHVSLDGTVTDITKYYDTGGSITREKERAPDEIQAGDFDLTLFNHDDKFSEFKPASMFYGTQYHLSQIKISVAFKSPSGMTEYYPICTGYIDELNAHKDESKVTLRCRDIMHKVIDEKLHLRRTEETPVADGDNTGDGTCSTIETLPFSVKTETWTLTCTTPGADSVAVFSVVGSVSGVVGSATSGVEYKNTSCGLKFMISAGDTPWDSGDAFTFQSFQRPEWTQQNPASIIWSVLTGHNLDTGATEEWADSVLSLDATRDNSNTEIDYNAFVTAASELTEFSLTGYVDYDESAQEFIQGLLLLFLGSIYTDGNGRISIKTWTPKQSAVIRTFADTAKISELEYTRSVNEIINYVRIAYKKSKTWQFSGEDVSYDGWHTSKDTTSIAKYGKLSEEYTTRWFMSGGIHAQLFTARLLARYNVPPLVVKFTTGADGLLSELGDRIYITDDKYGFTSLAAEISMLSKDISSRPLHISISARQDNGLGILYGYLGSLVDEGDGASPQALLFTNASDSDKLFCYLDNGYEVY